MTLLSQFVRVRLSACVRNSFFINSCRFNHVITKVSQLQYFNFNNQYSLEKTFNRISRYQLGFRFKVSHKMASSSSSGNVSESIASQCSSEAKESTSAVGKTQNISIDNEVSERNVGTMCGAWRGEEEDGGVIILVKDCGPFSPKPPKEEDDVEKVEDCWAEDVKIKVFVDNNQIGDKDLTGKALLLSCEKRKSDDADANKDLKKAKLETKALKAKRPGFTDDRYNETSYYIENGLRKVYPYYFTFTTFTKGRWVGERILDVFAREFRAHPAAEYERCVRAGTLTVNYDRVPPDYRLRHNDLLANVVHRHEVPVTCQPITVVHMDEDIVVVNKPASIPVHPCGRYRHNTVVFILAKEYNLKNLRTIHRLDRLTSGLLLFGRSPKKARQMEHQIRNRQVSKEYVCRVEGEFPEGEVECREPIEVVSYKIGVCRVSPKGKECATTFQRLGFNGHTSVVLCRPKTGRMHQIRVHLQYLGFPVVNDPLYNHPVFGPLKGKGGDLGGKTDEELVRDLISIHNAENWLGMDGDSELSLFKPKLDLDKADVGHTSGGEEECEGSRESSPSLESPTPATTAPIQLTPDDSMSFANNVVASPKPPTINARAKVTVATQTGHEAPDMAFNQEKMSVDPHCYECKVRYRDPRPSDLVMYLHAWKYKGPGWEYETELPEWASIDWEDVQSDLQR